MEDAYIYMVLEFGEIDLAGILSKKRKEMMESNEIIDENWLRFYWKVMNPPPLAFLFIITTMSRNWFVLFPS